MSRMRVKGDWEDVVEFYSMDLGKFLRRIGGGMWKGNVLVFGIVGRRWGKGIFENLREVEPGFVGWGGAAPLTHRMDQELFRWSSGISAVIEEAEMTLDDLRDLAQDYLLIEIFRKPQAGLTSLYNPAADQRITHSVGEIFFNLCFMICLGSCLSFFLT